MSPLGDITHNSFKLFVLRAALKARANHPELFATGSYEPLDARGANARHLFAFARVAPGAASITVVPRLIHSLAPGRLPVAHDWTDATLLLPPSLRPATRWRNAFTGDELPTNSALPVADVLATLPFALLIAAEATR
jgi:(1->4)-alpha-D-glucan 1-alpha-D-glucosylmutase